VQLTTWSHVVAAGDPASWTFNLSQTARAAGAVSSYTGVDTVTAVDATGTGTNVSGLTHTAPSVNTGGANRLGITITAPTAITTMTPPSGSTERADQAGGATTPTVSVETSDFAIAVAGASGTKQTVSAVAATSLTATIALRPVSTTGGSTANTTTSITKFYRSGGATVALRRDGTITWLLGDIQGGIAVSVPNGPGLTGVQRQRYLPYGQRRGSNLAASGTNSNDNITTTDHGFLGQVEDNTGLDYLNNRYHDPTLGRFVSVDPLVNKTHDAYGYGRNNPMTFTDPSGLDADTGMVLKSAASFNTKLTTLVHYFVQIDISTRISSGNIECKLANGGSIDVCSGSKAENRNGWQIAEVKKNSPWGYANGRSDLRYYSDSLRDEGVRAIRAIGGLTGGGGRTWPKSSSWEANGITISYFQPESPGRANNSGLYLYDYSTNMKAENAADQKALDAMIATIKAMNGSDTVMVPGLGSMPAPPQAATAATPEPTPSAQTSGNSFPPGYSAAAEAEAHTAAAAGELVGAGMNEDR
jgi:RHS repeat-associated protein